MYVFSDAYYKRPCKPCDCVVGKADLVPKVRNLQSSGDCYESMISTKKKKKQKKETGCIIGNKGGVILL